MLHDQSLSYDYQVFPWHTAPWEQLRERWSKGQLPHALLLSGQTGLGKRQFALRVAQFLLCDQPSAIEACGHCSHCQLFQAKNHPDFYFISPLEESKTIKIDTIRELASELSQSSRLGKYKIVLLTPTEALTVAGSNALLKSIEEPAQKTLFLLTTEEPRHLLATIRSRCQVLNFLPSSEGAAPEWLALADGSPLLAQHYQDNPELQTQYHQFMECLLRFEHDHDPLACSTAIAKLIETVSSDKIIKWLGQYFQDVLMLHVTTAIPAHLHHQHYQQQLTAIAKAKSTTVLFAAWDSFCELQRVLGLPNNLNVQLALDNFFIGLI